MKCSLLTLSTFIDSELPPRTRGEVEAHLVGCERCSRASGHLREESERIARLSRVTVAEHSVQTLMEQIGLIAVGGDMPARTSVPAVEPPADPLVPPWLAGDVGQALPWRATKKGVPRAIMPRTAPRETQVQPNKTEPEGDSKEGGLQPISNEVTEVDATTPEPLIDNFVVEPRQSSNDSAAPQLEDSFQLEPWSPTPINESNEIESVPAAFHAEDEEPFDNNFNHADDEPSDYELAAQPSHWQPPTKPVRVQRGFLDKIRDAIEIRRAVRRIPDEGEVEVFSGYGAPATNISPRRRVAQARDAAQHERRLQSAAAAAAPESIEQIRDNLDLKPAEIAPAHTPPAPIPAAPTPPAIPVEHGPAPEMSLDDLRRQAIQHDEPKFTIPRPNISIPRPKLSAAPRPRIPDLRPVIGGVGAGVRRVSSLGTMDQRLIALGAGAILLVAIGLSTGKTTTAIKPSTTSATAPAVHHTTTPAKKTTPSTAHSSAPAPVQSAQPQTLTNVQTLGKGGTGYAVGDIRYGQHTGYFRIVFDISGGGGGTPTTVVGFKSPTVMDVVFSGTSPSGATGVLPNATWVTNVTILPKTTTGQTVYEFTLAHAVTAKPGYGTSPTRLIIDLT